MDSFHQPLRILIIGTGIAGPTLALFLLATALPAPHKPHITLLERSPIPRTTGQNIDIRGAGVSIIRKLGLERAVRSHTTREEGVQFVTSANRIVAAGPADKTGRVQTGTSDIEILRGTLARLLLERCKAASLRHAAAGGRAIEFLWGDVVENIAQVGDVVRVTFRKTGETRDFDLVVGADGQVSRTRAMVWGADGEDQRMNRLGIYGGFFSMPRGETDSLWRRWWRAPGRRSIMIRPGEREEQSTVFMYVIDDGDRDARLWEVAVAGQKGVEEQKKLLEDYFGGAGWETGRVIKEMNEENDFYYSVLAQVKMDRWSKGRVVLVGDAGYCASPVSGMGTTLAFTGAYNLAGALTRHPNDIEAAFALYEEKQRPNVDKAQRMPLNGRHMHLITPETAWGVWTLHTILALFYYSGLSQLLMYLAAKFAGPPANAVPVEDYGFEDLPEWVP